MVVDGAVVTLVAPRPNGRCRLGVVSLLARAIRVSGGTFGSSRHDGRGMGRRVVRATVVCGHNDWLHRALGESRGSMAAPAGVTAARVWHGGLLGDIVRSDGRCRRAVVRMLAGTPWRSRIVPAGRDGVYISAVIVAHVRGDRGARVMKRGRAPPRRRVLSIPWIRH